MIKFDDKIIKIFDERFLIWVSGWADSMFLLYSILDYFQKNKKKTDNFLVITCNHNTRQQSKSDAIFVKEFCDKNNIKCIVANYWSKNIGSDIFFKENNLRKWRHSVFVEYAQKTSSKYLFLWHNLTDRFETTILNMSRWCYLNWFLSMKLVDSHFLDQNIKIVRPLIYLTKQEIFDLCKKYWVPFVQDQTNNDSSVSQRNFVRNKIFPLLENLSHKKKDWTLKFWDSIKNFYNILEKCSKFQKFKLKLIKQLDSWESQRAYELQILDQSLDVFVDLAHYLWFYNNVTDKVLKEIWSFLLKNKSWYKYWNWIYFFISHWKKFLIKTNKKDFWKNKNLWKKLEEWDDFIVRYPKFWDKFKWKTLNKYLINKKIPIFYREFVKIYEKDWKIFYVDCLF